MSWLNSELPVEWPTRNESNHTNASFRDFSTSRSDNGTMNVEPTVAIQADAPVGSEPWRKAVQLPKDLSQDSNHGLTHLFVPPPDWSNIDPADRSDLKAPNNTTAPSTSLSNSFDSDQSSTQKSSPPTSLNNPPSRKLKVFGRPDTYTSERLGNLLSSMSDANRGTQVGSTVNKSINDSDADIAGQLQNEGRKVLQGIAPPQSTLPSVPESSLDQLEQQLTHKGRPEYSNSLMSSSTKLDTTSSSFDSGSGNTLESLPAGLSNWDTMGPVPHHMLNSARPQRRSTQSPVGSNGRFSKRRDTELADLEAEISALSIQGPYADVSNRRPSRNYPSQLINSDDTSSSEKNSHEFRQERSSPQSSGSTVVSSQGSSMAQRDPEPSQPLVTNASQQYSNESRTNRRPYSSSPLPTQQHHGSRSDVYLGDVTPIPPLYNESPISTSQRSSSVESRLSNSEIGRRVISTSGSESAYAPPPVQQRRNLNNAYSYDMTPDTIVRRNLRFAGPNTRKVSSSTDSPTPRIVNTRPSSLSQIHNFAPLNRSTTTQQSTDPKASGSSRVSSSNRENTTSHDGNNTVDQSIAQKNVSFSAGYQVLAELIRERLPTASTDLSSVDSLDLSECDLETIVGLDKFVPKLTTLFLNDNNLRSLEGLPFNLVHLDLSANQLSFMNAFPPSFVSTLILTGNALRDLEPLANLRALSSLDVSNNQLTSLKGIENLTALRTLNVNNNRLTSLDVNLGMLTELSAANNSISAVQINAPNLESLDLESNRVVAISEPFPNLRELNLRFNDATVDFRGWDSLETVLFDGNRAAVNLGDIAGNLVTFTWEQCENFRASRTRLPQELLTSVRDLKLGGYSHCGWPFTEPRAIHSIQHLDLCNSNIRELPKDFSWKFPHLKSLNVAFNKLDDSCISILSECANLERLSVFGNRLKTTGEKLVALLPQLRVLDSRSQFRGQSVVLGGEYPSTVYTPLLNTAHTSTLLDTASRNLQWLDGKWTKHAGSRKPTTRPAFTSALYPLVWDPPIHDEGPKAAADYSDTSLVGSVRPWDILEALLVHRFLHPGAA